MPWSSEPRMPRDNLELIAVAVASHGSTSSGGRVHLSHSLEGCGSRLCLQGGRLYCQLNHG
jgi:hypothetical protein